MLTYLLSAFFALLILRVPVAVAMGLSALIALSLGPTPLPLQLIPQRMFVMISNTSLLAIPFFILAGIIMERGGLSRRMIRFAQALVGHWRGGLAQVDVVASTIFSALTGSSAASATATGTIMIPAMKRAGYPAGYAAALEASSATIGPIIPPSIIMIIYGSIAGVSIGSLFVAGIVPGLLIMAGLMVVNYLFARKMGWPSGKRAPWRHLWETFRDAFAALLTPVFIIGSIIFGIATPTEAGAIAVVYALFVAVVIYRDLSLRDVFPAFRDAAFMTGGVVFIIASAGIFGWILAFEQAPSRAVEFVYGMTKNPLIAVTIVIACVIIIGCVVDVSAAVILLVPVFHPLGIHYGFDPIHFALIMCIALVYGNVTPPVGILLFITASIAKCSVGSVMRYQPPFFIVLTVVLIVVVLFQDMILFLPRLLF